MLSDVDLELVQQNREQGLSRTRVHQHLSGEEQGFWESVETFSGLDLVMPLEEENQTVNGAEVKEQVST